MKETNQNYIVDIGTAAVLTAGLIFSMANYTFAAGTLSGTSVGNIATINYDVNGTPQPSIGSTEGGNTSGVGTETTFLVGTTINLTLVETNTTYTSAATGSLLQATGFTLTNLGNNSHGYNLTAANSALAVYGQADGYDVGTFAYYIDVNNDDLLDGGDTLITSVDTLAPDDSIKLLVTATIPIVVADTLQSTISLTAVTTTNNTIVAVIETSGAYDSTVVQIVFSDPSTVAAGTDPGQTEGDASAVALDAYRVLTAALSVSKTTAVYSDPANGLVNPKAIPGAILTYTITIVNNGTATATGISISDIIEEITTGTVAFSTQYDDSTTTCAAAQGIAVKDGSEAAPLCKTNVGDVDSANFTGITATAAGLALAAGETATMAFQITIQ
ncbi:MAG: putative repeat protein (TIGR01451 family) [Cellvibrionaceae bacterium]|jgi:uncharacterized repeat protein (TIGR01451 family)